MSNNTNEDIFIENILNAHMEPNDDLLNESIIEYGEFFKRDIRNLNKQITELNNDIEQMEIKCDERFQKFEQEYTTHMEQTKKEFHTETIKLKTKIKKLNIQVNNNKKNDIKYLNNIILIRQILLRLFNILWNNNLHLINYDIDYNILAIKIIDKMYKCINELKSEDILTHDLTHRLLNFIEEQIKLNEDKF